MKRSSPGVFALVDRIAAVVTEMVAPHKQMMAHMAAMPMMPVQHHPDNK
jgi:hypothetical protein